MLEYDKIRQFIHPYISQSNEPLLNNSVLSTDKYGTRITISRGKKVSRENYGEDGYVFVGGSVCMGWGCTMDSKTIPSYFSQISNQSA